jgi:hypothetical protein
VVKVKKFFQMNSTGRTLAAPATSRLILPNVNWKARVKAFPHASDCGLAAGTKVKFVLILGWENPYPIGQQTWK